MRTIRTRVDAPVGPPGNQTIVGTPGPDRFFGGAGNDDIFGRAGNDLLHGEDDDDRVFGEAGDDRLLGGTGNDVLHGGSGQDLMQGQSGNDLYVVDNARDVVDEAPGGGRDQVQSFITHTLAPNVEDLQLVGRGEIDGFGNALANVLSGNLGSFRIANRLDSGAGNDRLFGRDGNDILVGGAGNDLLDGGTGADLAAGGTGNDVYIVDNRGDRVIERENEGIDLVVTNTNEAMQANVENLRLTGLRAANVVGNDEANAISGNDANNIINGKLGNDQLFGFGGNDKLVGEVGRDILTGGAGNDVFIYIDGLDTLAGASRDIIQDFRLNEDLIDLSRLDANFLDAGSQDFTFIGRAAFSGAGQLRYNGALVQGDLQGDGFADFEIEIANRAALEGIDFIL